MAKLSKKKIDQLGERLRRAATPSAEDMRLLADYRDEHLVVLARVLFRISELMFPVPVVFSARQKNAQTIIEKLRRRENMEFSNMQDVAGARIVLLKGGRVAQDEVVAAICVAFPDHKKVLDRRLDPKAGYRAVHVPVKQDGYLAEIQIRTPYQDSWAQMFERLGDHWGRQIRYEEPPDNLQAPAAEGSPVTRVEVVEYTIQLADMLSELEVVEQMLATYDATAARASGAPSLETVRNRLAELYRNTGSVIKALSKIVPTGGATPLAITPTVRSERTFPHFLIAYRRSSGTVLEWTPFEMTDIDRIVAQRTQLEEDHRGDPDFEVVLLASHSEQDILRTHARYFKNLPELAVKPR